MDLLLGKQAIVDRNLQISAYELLFRSKENKPITCDTDATMQVVANTLSMFTTDNILGGKRGFINIDIDILRKGLLEILAPNKFVIEILETQTPTKELVTFIQELKRKGYMFALDDFIMSLDEIQYWEPILHEVHIIKVDVMDSSIDELKHKINILKTYKAALLAEKVETQEMFKLCHSLGFTYFQGYFFTKPVIVSGLRVEPQIESILHIAKLLQQDADISEIEESIKMYPDLVMALMKIINSASIFPVQEITSIRQTIALLGKKALSQWILLMLYTRKNEQNSTDEKASTALYQTAVQRAKTMELLAQAIPSISANTKNEAFLTGLLSLSDTLLQTPMSEILQNLYVSQNISQALLKGEGQLGDLLNLVKAWETQNTGIISLISTQYKLTMEQLNSIFIKSFKFSGEMLSQST
ncbi:MAG: EAL and HDOD domain-containing protein [Brevinemataceae bacterium]